MPVEVVFTPEFKRAVRQLARRYRHLRGDLQPLLDGLARGETPGDRIAGTGVVVYKVRVANSDAQRGRSGGYRVIYSVHAPRRTVLLTLYSKTDQGDISPDEIRRILGSVP